MKKPSKVTENFSNALMIHSDQKQQKYVQINLCIFASTNPQYDDRLFIELQVQCMEIPSSEHRENILCTQIVFCFCFDA